MKLINDTQAANALAITTKQLLALCAEGLPHTYSRTGRTFNMQAVAKWLAKRATAAAPDDSFDPVAEAAKLLGCSYAEARTRLESGEFLRERTTQTSEAERSKYIAEMDRRMGLTASDFVPTVRKSACGGTVEFSSHKPNNIGAVEARLLAGKSAPARDITTPPESSSKRDEERARMDAAMGLHKGGVRRQGNSLVFSPPSN